jgi:DNA-binding CsgD family transcriptional regulator/PAS domain-containing protein
VASPDTLVQAIEGLYAASAGAGAWELALDRLAAASGFSSAALTLFREERKPFKSLWRNIPDEVAQDYLAYYHRIDPSCIFDHPHDTLIYDYRYIDESLIDRSEFYAWKIKSDGTCYHLGAPTGPGLPFSGSLTLHRPRPAGHADGHEIDVFTRLFRHLELALTVDYRLGLSGSLSGLAGEVLDHATTGIVVLDHAGRVIFANHRAREIDRAQDGLALGPDRPRAPRPREDTVLQRLLQSAARDAGGIEPRGGAVRLPRPSGKRAYAVVVAPLPAATGLFGAAKPGMTLLITDPDATVALDPARLVQLYDLTPAELRVAQRLMMGDTPSQTAAALGIGIKTVRDHLRGLFRKTETARQADLLRLLLTVSR